MCVKLDILKYLHILNHTTTSLVYISRLLTIHTKYSLDDIKTFYIQYSYVTKDVKVSSKLGLSINYVLTNNFDLLRIINNDFFIQLLIDYESDLILPDDLELRLVSLINTLSDYNPCLLRYVTKYKNKLDFSEISVKNVSSPVSYYMSYTGSNIYIIRQIILKSRAKNFKTELDKYICTQGCINNILLYNCIIQNIYKVFYVSNIDIKECRENICYKHLVEYLNKSRMLQRYFVKEGSLEIILKYPEHISVLEFIRKIEEDKRFKCSDISSLFSTEEIILIFYILRKQYNIQDASLILGKCSEYSDLFIEFCYYHNIDPCRYDVYEDSEYKSIKYRKISVTDLDINNLIIKSKMLLNLLQSDKKACIKIIADKDIKKDEILHFLEFIFIKYDFKFVYELILEIINLHGKAVVDRIQLYLLDILEEGFFEECYFDMIKIIYSKLLSYSTTIKTKKNNDSILILLSRYCKYFDKELYLGNIKR
ncbi:hypothetical protein P3W45_000829 [Vairimorpha bombi]|jgi:hypothetical protein